MEEWITQELERTELGDKRRTKRLIKIVSNLSASPEASVPQASGTWSQTKATYDFWDSPYIKPSMKGTEIHWTIKAQLLNLKQVSI